MQQLLLVNYHYVREPNAHAYPGIHPISPGGFARQLNQLAAQFHLASPHEVEAFVLEGRELPADSVLITFDDGLLDHAETACNILDPMGVKAVFFVCSRPLTEERAVSVHKIHWLRATTEPERFGADFHAALPPEWRERTLSPSERKAAAATYIYDQRADAETKYLLNFLLPEQVVDAATSTMLRDRGIDEADFCRRTYMSADVLRGLLGSGHRVEAHTHDHRPVTRLGADENAVMSLHVRALEEILGRRPRWISYPYGREWALPRDPGAFCRRHGFDIGVSLKGTWVKPENAPYALDRINTNEVEQVMGRPNVAAG